MCDDHVDFIFENKLLTANSADVFMLYVLNVTAEPVHSKSLTFPDATQVEDKLSHAVWLIHPPFPCNNSNQKAFKTVYM